MGGGERMEACRPLVRPMIAGIAPAEPAASVMGMVGRPGLEPGTSRLKVVCSPN